MIGNAISSFKNNKGFLVNLFSLYALQGINYFVPFLTIPIISSALGVSEFGMYSYILAVITYLNTVVTFGFNYSTTREISFHLGDKKKIGELFSTTLAIKGLLVIVCTIFSFLLFFFTSAFQSAFRITGVIFLYLIGNLLLIDWFYQGIQKMQFVAIANASSKILFLVSLLLWLPRISSITPIFFLSLSGIVAGIISLWFAIKKYAVILSLPTQDQLRKIFKESSPFFISQITVHFYSTINLIILKAVATDSKVAIYSWAEKLFYMFTAIFFPLSAAIFPYLANKYSISKSSFIVLFKKAFNIYFLVGIGLFLIGFSFAPQLIYFVSGGNPSSEAIVSFQLISLAIPFVPLGALYSQFSAIVSKPQFLIKAVFFTAFINILLVYPIIRRYGVPGLAFLTGFNFIFIFSYLHLGLKKHLK
jgi:polysaccharide transporter, PST family